ncbi:unnamed protein product [Rangifer tarandus platyrhynchus]
MGGDGAPQSLGDTEQASPMLNFLGWCPSASCQHPHLYWLLLMGLAEGFGGVGRKAELGEEVNQRPLEKGGHRPEPRIAAAIHHPWEARKLVSRTSFLE